MPAEKDSSEDDPILRRDDQGRVYFDIEHPQDRANRRLNPAMGTEIDQQWQAPPPKPDAAPLLDLDLAWKELVASTPLTVQKNEQVPEGKTVDECNAALIVREIQYHILAPSLYPGGEGNSADDGDPNDITRGWSWELDGENDGDTKKIVVEETGEVQKTAKMEVAGPEDNVEKEGKKTAEAVVEESGEKAPNETEVKEAEESETGKGSNPVDQDKAIEKEKDDDDKPAKSIYGASILLKLQFQDRKKQKAVPRRTSEELALFISDVTMKLEEALKKNPEAAQKVLDAIAFDLTPLLFCRFLDGMETGTTVLEECSYSLLKLCSERANPKEMHMAIKSFTSMVDKVYLEATAYLILQPLLELWGNVISRIARKRKAFLAEVIKLFGRMYSCATSFENAFVPDSGNDIGVEQRGRVARIPDVLLEMYEKLIKKQMLQRDTDTAIGLQVDMLGREKPFLPPVDLPAEGNGAATARNAPAAKISGETLDWVCERAMTLSQLLQILVMLWNRLPPPHGEDRNVPKSKSKKVRKNQTGSGRQSTVEEREQSIATCVQLFSELGWSNPVMVCQLAMNGLNLEQVSRDADMLSRHLGEDVRSKKEKKNTLYSMASVALYLCSMLRRGTRARMAGEELDSKGNEYEVDLNGSAFDLLNPSYAVDLVLPYLMNVIPQTAPSVSMVGIATMRAFLDRVEDGHYTTYDELLRLRSGTSSMGKDCSLVGLACHLGRAVGMLDDPKHRRMAYETLQTLLRKCHSLPARFVVLECLFYETNRVVVAGQLMKEMKDIIQLLDRASWDGGNGSSEGVMVASKLRTRFAHNCFARYFVPRRELLASMNPIMSASSFFMFMAVSDRRMLGKVDGDVKEEVERRMRFCREYGRLGKECIRAFGAVAEHDRKTLPKSEMAKKNAGDAMAVFAASGRTLNQCVTSLSFLETGLGAL